MKPETKKPKQPKPDRSWLDRLRQEQEKLGENLAKLKEFVDDGEKFSDLSAGQQSLMQEQIDAMERYATILSDRIALAESEGPATDDTDDTDESGESEDPAKG